MKTDVTGPPAARALIAATFLRVSIVLLTFLLYSLSSCQQADTNTTKQTTPPKSSDFAYQYTEPETPDTENPVTANTKATVANNISPTITALTDVANTQVFTVKNNKDTIITGAKGVKLIIPQNSFNVPNSAAEVKVEMKEYATASDFVFGNLTTTSNGQLLESGGTVHISATCMGKEVSLKKDKQLSLAFPTGKAKPKSDMLTFYGEKSVTGDINWQPTDFKADVVGKDAINNKVVRWRYKTVSRTKWGQKLSLLNGWKFQVQAFGSNGHCTRFADTTNYNNVLEYLQDKFTISPDDFKYLKGSYLMLTYRFNNNGVVEKVEVKGEHHRIKNVNKRKQADAAKRVRTNIINTLKNMPKGEASHVKGNEVVRFYFNNFNNYKNKPELKINDNKVKKTVTDRVYLPDTMTYQQYQAWLDSTAAVAKVRHDSLMQTDADYYMMNTGKLGWINCDRFYDNNKPKTNIIAAVKPNKNVTVKLIFKDILSVMNMNISAGNYMASQVPVKEKACIMVVEKRPEGNFYAIKDIYTSYDIVEGFDFKPLTMEAVKKELDKL
jgi:hypothetical protein